MYTSKQIFPMLEPMPVPIGNVSTLTGLATYLFSNVDNLSASQVFIHIQTPRQVSLVGVLQGNFKQRPVYLTATAEPPDFRFGGYYPVEEFIIALQSMFVQTPQLCDILRITGNLQSEDNIKIADDGVTQKVTVKRGVTRVEEVGIKNPVLLQPYRTFIEVEQPESPFIFRIKRDVQNGCTCALFDADGGAWQLEAMARIKAWIMENTQGIAVIA